MHKLAGVWHAVPLSRELANVAASANGKMMLVNAFPCYALALPQFLVEDRSPLIPFASFDGLGGQDALSFRTLR